MQSDAQICYSGEALVYQDKLKFHEKLGDLMMLDGVFNFWGTKKH